MSLHNLSVRTRLGSGFALVIVLLLGVAVTSLAQLASFNRNVEALVATRLVQLITVAQASNTLSQISRGTRNVLVLDDEKQVKDELAAIHANQGAVQELLTKVERNVTSSRERDLFAEIVQARTAY